MPSFTRENAEVHVYTFKEGMLSSVAHDLRIGVQEFEVEIDGSDIRAEIDLRSLHVVCARKRGVDAPELLSESDRAKIQKTMRNEVLHTERYPYTVFEADLDDREDGELPGRLELHGEEREVVATLRDDNGALHVEVEVHQPDFGIKPYSAMFGSLKVKANVRIVVELKGYSLALHAKSGSS